MTEYGTRKSSTGRWPYQRVLPALAGLVLALAGCVRAQPAPGLAAALAEKNRPLPTLSASLSIPALSADEITESEAPIELSLPLSNYDSQHNLTWTAQSSDQSVVQDSSIVIQGVTFVDGQPRLVISIAPETVEAGTATITLSWADRFKRREASFEFVIQPESGPPPITSPTVLSNGHATVWSDTALNGAKDVSADGSLAVYEYSGQVYLYESATKTRTRLSKFANGAPAGGANPRISDDGSKVVFDSGAALVAGDTNGLRDIYVYEVATQTLSLLTSAGTETITSTLAYGCSETRTVSVYAYCSGYSEGSGASSVSCGGSDYVFDYWMCSTTDPGTGYDASLYVCEEEQTVTSDRIATDPTHTQFLRPDINADGTKIVYERHVQFHQTVFAEEGGDGCGNLTQQLSSTTVSIDLWTSEGTMTVVSGYSGGFNPIGGSGTSYFEQSNVSMSAPSLSPSGRYLAYYSLNQNTSDPSMVSGDTYTSQNTGILGHVRDLELGTTTNLTGATLASGMAAGQAMYSGYALAAPVLSENLAVFALTTTQDAWIELSYHMYCHPDHRTEGESNQQDFSRIGDTGVVTWESTSAEYGANSCLFARTTPAGGYELIASDVFSSYGAVNQKRTWLTGLARQSDDSWAARTTIAEATSLDDHGDYQLLSLPRTLVVHPTLQTVAFDWAYPLVDADTNGAWDVYSAHAASATVSRQLESQSEAGVVGNLESGRMLYYDSPTQAWVFLTSATNLDSATTPDTSALIGVPAD